MSQIKGIEIRKANIEPIGDFFGGKDFLGPEYWNFFAICFVGLMIGGLIPLILIGPIYCGIAYTFIQRAHGARVEFADVFKGFDYFVEGLLAVLIHVAAVMVLFIPFVISFIVSIILMATGEAPLMLMGGIGLGLSYIGWIMVSILSMPVILFATMLIVDKKLTAWPAVQCAFKGVMKNLPRIILTELFIHFCIAIGMMMCIVPGILMTPMLFAAHFVAYCKIFGLEQYKQPVMAQAV